MKLNKPFNALIEPEIVRLMAISSAVSAQDCLPLVSYLGNNAPKFFKLLSECKPEKTVFLSEFWNSICDHDFVQDFVFHEKFEPRRTPKK